MKKKSLGFALLVSDLALIQYFSTMVPFLPSGKATIILSHCMLKVCDMCYAFFILILDRVIVKGLP